MPDDRLRVDHGDVFGEWRVSLADGHAQHATSKPGQRFAIAARTVRRRSRGRRDAIEDARPYDVSLSLTLTAWQILGAVDRAIELAVDHVNNRIQFGKPISAFQAVQFQLADAAVAAAGLRELAQFTMFRLADRADRSARGRAGAARARARRRPRRAAHVVSSCTAPPACATSTTSPSWLVTSSPRCGCPSAPSARRPNWPTRSPTDGFVGLFPHGGARTSERVARPVARRPARHRRAHDGRVPRRSRRTIRRQRSPRVRRSATNATIRLTYAELLRAASIAKALSCGAIRANASRSSWATGPKR